MVCDFVKQTSEMPLSLISKLIPFHMAAFVPCVLSMLAGFFIALMISLLGLEDLIGIRFDWLHFSTNSYQNSLMLISKEPNALARRNYNVAVLPQRHTDVAEMVPLIPEVESALRLALQMNEQGKKEKAMKLLEQCKSLSPGHPDVLNQYGELVEADDIIGAEHHFALALVQNPHHSKASENRKRLLPLVRKLDGEMLLRIERKRDKLMMIPEGNAALTRAKLEGYYQYIYHTNGIEGNTMTLSMTRAIVETGVAVGGKSIMEHNEVLGMDAALKYINNTLLSKFGQIDIGDILEIHKRVLGYVNPIDAGLFRNTQVYVGDHVPPSPTDVEKYMTDFSNWLQSRDVLHIHPIELASLAHYKLVFIHPFTDGNGRTSRLLMNYFLMKAGYPPVIIKKEQRFEYYEYLQKANMGDVRPFIRFVARCTEATLDNYLSSVTIIPKKTTTLIDDFHELGFLKGKEKEQVGECNPDLSNGHNDLSRNQEGQCKRVD